MEVITVGRDASADLGRVRAARMAIGPSAQPFVDANGACSRTQALAHAARSAEFDVSWFEEPVPSDDLESDGFRPPIEGALRPDLSRPGFGLELKRQDAVRYAA